MKADRKPNRSLNETTGLKEYLFRESYLSGNLQAELEKAVAKIESDGRRKNLEHLRRKGIHFEGRVLELGAGTCWLSAEISKTKGEIKVYALDFARTILTKLAALVIERLGADVKRITRVVGDFNHLPFADKTFRFVVTDAALHHAIRTEAVLEEIGRVLDDHGRFLAIREPVLPTWRKNLRYRLGAKERAQGVTENIFTKKEWRACFEKAHLDVQFLTARRTHPPTTWKLLKKILRALLIPWLNPCLFGSYYFLATKRRPSERRSGGRLPDPLAS